MKRTFERLDTVVSAKVIRNPEPGRTRGFDIVEMESSEEAKSAIEALNDSEIEGRNIAVNEANPRN